MTNNNVNDNMSEVIDIRIILKKILAKKKLFFKAQNKELLERKYPNKSQKRRLQKICWILLFQWESRVQKNRG